MMKNRTKIAIAGVTAGALAVTAMVLNKHPEKEIQMPAEETLTEVTPNTEENLTEMSPEPEMKTEAYEPDAFYITPITDDIFTKMQGRSYKADCTIDREELRYVHILHTGFDGETKEGELVVNKAIADDVLAIFEELYRAKYPIEKVRLVDEYGADDEASMSDNN
ncbi:MAG: M15 family peptidase, partial [Lachnospiraceae bacterium]|nr:M15 family peptidase [Lachnospiraceae bacterium]